MFLTKVSFSFAIDKRRRGALHTERIPLRFYPWPRLALMAFRVKMARVALAKRSEG